MTNWRKAVAYVHSLVIHVADLEGKKKEGYKGDWTGLKAFYEEVEALENSLNRKTYRIFGKSYTFIARVLEECKSYSDNFIDESVITIINTHKKYLMDAFPAELVTDGCTGDDGMNLDNE